MLNPFKLVDVYIDLNKVEAVAKEKTTMSTKIPQIVALVLQVLGFTGAAAWANGWVSAHMLTIVIINAVLVIGHALLPSIVPAPIEPNPPLPVSPKALALLLAFLLAPMLVRAQAAPTIPAAPVATSNGFAASGGPLAVHYNGTWSAASFTRESYDVVDFGALKANHVYVQGVELVMPTPGVNVYLGGLSYQPNISSLFAKTNLPAASFGLFVDGNLGNGIPSTGASHISWLAGGGVLYKITSALTWTPLTAQYGRFGGNRFAAISTQLGFIFGGQK